MLQQRSSQDTQEGGPAILDRRQVKVLLLPPGAATAAAAAFMPLNKNICHLLLAFWLNAKLNEEDLHISLPAFAFKYTWQLLPSL